jgi:RNA polymerase sigma-70 factor (ECF subfamily)
MTVDDRMVFALRFIEGMELQEIATELAVSLSTVKRRLARASTRFEAAARHTRCLRDWQPGGAQ